MLDKRTGAYTRNKERKRTSVRTYYSSYWNCRKPNLCNYGSVNYVVARAHQNKFKRKFYKRSGLIKDSITLRIILTNIKDRLSIT